MLFGKSKHNAVDDELSRRIGSVAIGKCGALGASFAASTLKTDEIHDVIHLALDLQRSMELVLDYFKEHGEPLYTSENSNVPMLSACVGAGYGNLNPAILCVEFIAKCESSTKLNITGYAKEGLIKQKTALKAIESLKLSLT